MARAAGLYYSVSYNSLGTYVDMQKDGSSGLSKLQDIRNTINQSLDSDVKLVILKALNDIENNSSLTGSVSSLKKNLKKVDSCLEYFPDYVRYYRRYLYTDDEDTEEKYYKKACDKLKSIESKL